MEYSEEETLKMKLEDIFEMMHRDDVEGAKSIIYENLGKRNKNFKYVFRIRGKSGKYFWREDSVSVIYEDDGSYSKYIIISRDISTMKNAETKI